jgi:hypothetical protein
LAPVKLLFDPYNWLLIPLRALLDPVIMLPPLDVVLTAGCELKTDFHFDLSLRTDSKADCLSFIVAILNENGEAEVDEVDEDWMVADVWVCVFG